MAEKNNDSATPPSSFRNLCHFNSTLLLSSLEFLLERHTSPFVNEILRKGSRMKSLTIVSFARNIPYAYRSAKQKWRVLRKTSILIFSLYTV